MKSATDKVSVIGVSQTKEVCWISTSPDDYETMDDKSINALWDIKTVQPSRLVREGAQNRDLEHAEYRPQKTKFVCKYSASNSVNGFTSEGDIPRMMSSRAAGRWRFDSTNLITVAANINSPDDFLTSISNDSSFGQGIGMVDFNRWLHRTCQRVCFWRTGNEAH